MIGLPEPNWTAKAYSNGDEVELGASDFAGRWHVIYFYPLDFTFICPTELRGFEALKEQFDAESIDLLGSSTDSFHSHRAWFADRSIFPNPITHPVLADTAHTVSRAFGVLNPELGIAYRATVIIDDRAIVRSLSINDVNAGRSPSEILRTAIALQTGELCGADWRKGDRYAA